MTVQFERVVRKMNGLSKRNILENIYKCQKEVEELNTLEEKEDLEIEKMYVLKRKHCYEKREELIRTISFFWANVFLNHPFINGILETREKECIACLDKMEVNEIYRNSFLYDQLKLSFKDSPYLRPNTVTIVKDFTFRRRQPPAEVDINLIENPKKFFLWLIKNTSDDWDKTGTQIIIEDIWKNPTAHYSGETNTTINSIAACHTDIKNLEIAETRELENSKWKYVTLRQVHLKKRNEFTKDFPFFWISIFLERLPSRFIKEDEKKYLSFLDTLEVEEYSKDAFEIKIVFHDNPYFENNVVIKQYKGENVEMSSPLTWKNNVTKHNYNNETLLAWLTNKTNEKYDFYIAENIKEEIWGDPFAFYELSSEESSNDD